MPEPGPAKRPSLPKQLQLFGEYVIDALVEEGPTWALYKALHISNENARFRVRVLTGVDATRRQVVEAFARMAILLESLKHDGIIPVAVAGVDQGLVFIINAEVPGITLKQRIESGLASLEPSEVVRIVREAGSVLDYLHHHDPPIVHRTLDPSKILLSQPTGAVKLLEVGYAHAVDEVARVEPIPFSPRASDGFRPPEDVSGALLTAAADQYSLARIAETCLSARSTAANQAALTAAAPVLARALSSDPTARYPSAGAFATALEEVIETIEISAPSAPVAPARPVGLGKAGAPSGPARKATITGTPAISAASTAAAAVRANVVSPPVPLPRSNTGSYASPKSTGNTGKHGAQKGVVASAMSPPSGSFAEANAKAPEPAIANAATPPSPPAGPITHNSESSIPAILQIPAAPASTSVIERMSEIPLESMSIVPLDDFAADIVTSVSAPDETLIASASPSKPPTESAPANPAPSPPDVSVASATSTAPLFGGPPAVPPTTAAIEPAPVAPQNLAPKFEATPGAQPLVEAPRPAPVSPSVPPRAQPVSSAVPKSNNVRIAAILGGSIVLASLVYTGGVVLREPLMRLAQGNAAQNATPSPPPTASNDMAPNPSQIRTPVAVTNDASVAVAPIAVVQVDAGHVAVAAVTTPDAGHAQQAVVDAGSPTAIAVHPAASSLPHTPSREAQDQTQATLVERIGTCGVHLGHHAYIHVVYDGATGQASQVEFTGHTLDGNPLAPCVEAAVRAVPVPPFADAHFETRYTVMLR